MEKKIPMRTCVCCKKVMPKKEMYRVVKSGDEIFFDYSGRANGRGAYICGDSECLAKFKKSKALNRAFSFEVSEEVYDKIAEELNGKRK